MSSGNVVRRATSPKMNIPVAVNVPLVHPDEER
jgi:hypothetical protein